MTQIQGGNGIKTGGNQMELAESYMSQADILARQNAMEPDGIAGKDAYDVAKDIHYEKSVKSNTPDTVMNNFNEYRKDMQEKAKTEGENAAADEHEKNEEEREIARHISSEERKQLAQLGIDVESTELSDLISLVNRLRSEEHKQELSTLLTMAKVNQGDMDSLMVTSDGVSVAGSNVSLNRVNVMEVAAHTEREEKPSGQIPVTEKEFLYLERNHLQINQENLYKAHYSGQKVEETELPPDMLGQLEKVVEQAGFAENADAIAGAKLLFANGMPVTTDAVRDYMHFKQYEGMDIQDVPNKQQMEVISEENLMQGKQLYEEIKQVSTLAVYDMAQEGKVVTIASARTYTAGRKEQYGDAAYVEDRLARLETSQDRNAVVAMRQMEEIRLVMTEKVATRMLKYDINVDTRELSQVVADLRAVEKQLTLEAFAREGIAPTEENLSTYQQMQQKVQEIGAAPARNLGLLLKGTEFTVNRFHAEIKMQQASFDMSGRSGEAGGSAFFESIRRSYEAVGTAPRADMGDSITKAFSNAADMLTQMQLPVTEENLRGVRILGYNSIEITESNLREVVNYDRQVNDMMDAFYPEAVLSMIKDGINPMDVPIDELNRLIRGRNYNNGVTEAENFATYLRDMEKQGELTKEERESYIGMFRFMDKLAKSGDREAGFLFANGSRLTVRNLLTAMRSRRAAGLDVSVDDSFGMLQDMEINGKAIDQQIERAFSLGDDQWDAVLSEEQIARYMEEMEIPFSAINAQALSLMMSENGSFYDLASAVMSKLRFQDHSKEDLVDEETGNMAASLDGEEIGIDFPMVNLLEKLRGSEEMSLTYEDMREQLMERMYAGGIEGSLSSADLASIKLVQAGFHVLGQMARKDHYQMPVATRNGVQVVNLTVQHSETMKGSVDIRMPHETYGSLTAKLQFGEDGSLSGYVVAATSEANVLLLEAGEDLSGELEAVGFSAVSVSFGKMNSVSQRPAVHKTDIPSMDVYEVAIHCVKLLAGL